MIRENTTKVGLLAIVSFWLMAAQAIAVAVGPPPDHTIQGSTAAKPMLSRDGHSTPRPAPVVGMRPAAGPVCVGGSCSRAHVMRSWRIFRRR
jgi:hypothetical protein